MQLKYYFICDAASQNNMKSYTMYHIFIMSFTRVEYLARITYSASRRLLYS